MIKKTFQLFVLVAFSATGVLMAQEATSTESEPVVESASESTYSSGNSTIYQDGDVIYSTSATKFQLNSTDQTTSVDFTEYKIDDGEFARYVDPFSITGDGIHHVLYHSVDTVGNREVDKSYSVVIDDTAPEISLANSAVVYEKDGKKFVPGSNELTLSASDNLSGVKVIRYSINGGAQEEYTTPITTNQSGSFTVEYSAEDNLGNVATATTEAYSVEVDDAPPMVSIEPINELTTVQDVRYGKRGAGFKIEATDNESGVRETLVRIDEQGEFIPATKELFLGSSGRHVIEAKAIDNVGNESEVQRFEYMQDDEPPVTDITPVAD